MTTATSVLHKSTTAEHSVQNIAETITRFIHHHFLKILTLTYLLAGTLPAFGLWLRSVKFGTVHWFDGSSVNLSLSLLMLAFLLFNAGLGIKTEELIGMLKKPGVLLMGLLANTFVPLLLVAGLAVVLQFWHSTDEVQLLLLGLAMIVAMPIAGSSTAWSQNANGNLSLSLGLVFLSTILSPLTTPALMAFFAMLTSGHYANHLNALATEGTNAFMVITVVVPSVLGILTRFLFGAERVASLKSYLKLGNFTCLLLLNYSNASTALPKMFITSDPDFLILACCTTMVICAMAFAAAWLIAKLLKSDDSDKAALMFGLGMNNNGTGLVLAAAALADHPAVMLPIISYTLVQQAIAGFVDWKMFKQVD